MEALEPVKTCSFSRDSFYEVLRLYPDIAVKIIEELGERMNRMENALQSMGVRNVDERVSALLLDFAEKYGAPVLDGTLIHLPLSREGMANYLGITRETVSRKLGLLENEGIIRSNGNKSINRRSFGGTGNRSLKCSNPDPFTKKEAHLTPFGVLHFLVRVLLRHLFKKVSNIKGLLAVKKQCLSLKIE